MNIIEFRIQQTSSPCNSQDKEVRLFVDGQDLIGSESGELGIHPRVFYRQTALLEGGVLTYARCSCGDIGCGSQDVMVTLQDCEISWIQSSKLKYVFNERQYRDALEKVMADRTWENDEDTFQRQAGEFDYSRFGVAGWQLYWVSLQPASARILLSFRNSTDQYESLAVPFQGEGQDHALAILQQSIPHLGPEDFTPKRNWYVSKPKEL